MKLHTTRPFCLCVCHVQGAGQHQCDLAFRAERPGLLFKIKIERWQYCPHPEGNPLPDVVKLLCVHTCSCAQLPHLICTCKYMRCIMHVCTVSAETCPPLPLVTNVAPGIPRPGCTSLSMNTSSTALLPPPSSSCSLILHAPCIHIHSHHRTQICSIFSRRLWVLA